MDFQLERRTDENGRPDSDQIDTIKYNFEGMECNAHLSDAKILELMNSNGLESASTPSLFSIVKKILDESAERRNGDTSQLVSRLLRAIVQVIEKRFSSQSENVKNQNRLFKVREDRYRIRIRALETLAMGTTEENMVLMNKFQQIKTEKIGVEEINKQVEENLNRLKKEKLQRDTEITMLKKDLETIRSTHAKQFLEVEAETREAKVELEMELKTTEHLLEDSRRKVKELEVYSKSKSEQWRRKEYTYHSFIDFQSKALQDLRGSSDSIKDEFLKTRQRYLKEFNQLGIKLRGLADAAQNYHAVLAENRKLYNEVQDLKGNIRVYCRIRPFLPGQNRKQTTIELIGENGDIVVSNPLKHGKDSHKLFKFNKVFGPVATQEEVFLDTRPLIRSVLDGYNVCIFAYGQTGSGKTYTMSGPNMSSKEDWGVNYRALHDLFQISQIRRSSISYEVGVQMVEIYNEQVRDLLASGGAQKRLGIWNITQPNGLAVPDASMHPVRSTGDVLELMNIGLMNRAIGATAINERSSRSHSVLTVHVLGTDMKTNEILRGNLHLVDLAGSERVDRSEATGDRLREAQHINKSLSALGDVIFALAHKSSHVPYRNSKLTQLLQSSLGGQAKTLMFVQINPDVNSYSETVSTLKFAERVSGVELGAARSNKEGRDLKELMEQVGSLKDTVAKKDGEIERLLLLQANSSGENSKKNSQIYRSPSPRRHSLGTPQLGRGQSVAECLELNAKIASDGENCSKHSDSYSEAGCQQSIHECRRPKESLQPSKLASGIASQNSNEEIELLGFAEGDTEERLSDISDGGLSMGTESDSMGSAVENTLFPDVPKPAESAIKRSAPSKIKKPVRDSVPTRSSQFSGTKSLSKISSSRKTLAGSSSSTKPLKRFQ